ncbi:MAG: ABC transporter substrate-binding protein [Planctomycetes bacterium]|nr:ABC transporter substrate-binding protein [Planctomycetota bacterium]
MSTVLSGPASDLGQGMRDGVECAFAEYNRALPPEKAPLALVALDDGYEPERCAPNMRELVERRKVLAIVGNVGTPTAVAALPIAIQSGTPFFGAFTGAGVLRKTPPERYVINYRASYGEETAAMVEALVRGGLAPGEIAFFTQRDAFGDAGFEAGMQALVRHGLKSATSIVHGRYERNTTVVEGALAQLLLAPTPPRAVLMVGTYAPCAALIRRAHEHGFTPLFIGVSFVGAASLVRELGKDGDGVAITQVVPYYGEDRPLCREFRAALERSAPGTQPSYTSFEGYIAARIFCKALSSCPVAPGREEVVDALLSLGRFDIGLETPLQLSPTEHQACHEVWLSVIRDGAVQPLAWERMPELLRGK